MCELPFVKKCSWERQNDRRNSLDRTLKILNLAKMVLKLTADSANPQKNKEMMN